MSAMVVTCVEARPAGDGVEDNNKDDWEPRVWMMVPSWKQDY